MTDKYLAYKGLTEIDTIDVTTGFYIPVLSGNSVKKFSYDSARFTNTGTLDNGDRIEILAENETAARDVTLKLDGLVSVTERSS